MQHFYDAIESEEESSDYMSVKTAAQVVAIDRRLSD